VWLQFLAEATATIINKTVTNILELCFTTSKNKSKTYRHLALNVENKRHFFRKIYMPSCDFRHKLKKAFWSFLYGSYNNLKQIKSVKAHVASFQ